MSRGQRIVLGAVGAVIVVVLLAAGVAVVVKDGDEARLAVGGVTAERRDDAGPPRSTVTTYALVPVTGGEALPTTAPPPPPKPPQPLAAPPPPPTTAPPVPRAGSDQHVLRPPPDGTPARPIDKAKGCYSAVDPGWKVVECGALKRDDVVFVWVVEAKRRSLRALVLRERTAGQWALVLAAEGSEGPEAGWTRIGVRGEDVSGDGRPDLVFGFHRRGGALVAEVVDAPGAVTLSLPLAGPTTSVRLEKGALHAWQSRADGSADHDTLRVVTGAWRVAASEPVPRASVPPSMV